MYDSSKGVWSRNVVGGVVHFITQTLRLETSNVLDNFQDGSKLVVSLMLLILLSDSKQVLKFVVSL